MGIVLCTTYIPLFLESLEGLVSPTIPSQSATNFMCDYIANFVTFDAFCRFQNLSEMMQLSKSQECSDKEHKVMTTTQSSQESKCSPTPTLKSI